MSHVIEMTLAVPSKGLVSNGIQPEAHQLALLKPGPNEVAFG